MFPPRCLFVPFAFFASFFSLSFSVVFLERHWCPKSNRIKAFFSNIGAVTRSSLYSLFVVFFFQSAITHPFFVFTSTNQYHTHHSISFVHIYSLFISLFFSSRLLNNTLVVYEVTPIQPIYCHTISSLTVFYLRWTLPSPLIQVTLTCPI